MRRAIRLILGGVCALLLSACGSGNGSDDPVAPATQPDPTSQAIIVTPSLGATTGASAQAFDTDGNPISDAVTTGANGFATLQIPFGRSGPVLIRIQGAPGATYFDEATGASTPFPDTDQFRVAMSAPRARVGVSILTELAVRVVEAGGNFDAAAIDAANEQIRAALAPDVADLLVPPTLVDASTGAGSIGDTDAGRLAARLGALAMLAPMDATPALTVLRQLSDDLSDGVVDGNGADGAISDVAYDAANFATTFVAAVQEFAASFGNAALQTRAGDAQASGRVSGDGDASGGTGGGTGGDTGGDSGGSTGGGTGGDSGAGTGGGSGAGLDPDGDGINGTTSPATVDSALVGTFTLIYADRSDASTRDPVADGEEVTAEIGADGTLTLTSTTLGTLTLSNPFNRSLSTDGSPHLPEIIWYDANSDLEYALSDNQRGTFNEINVGDASMPQEQTFGLPGFLGQLRAPEPPPGEAIARFAGTVTMKMISSCGTATECPNAKGVGETLQVIVGSDGTITVDGFVIDPAADTATGFFDGTSGSSVEPSFTLNFAESETVNLGVNLYTDGAAVSALQLRRSVTQPSGGSRNFSIYAELEPLPQAFLDYFRDFVALASPSQLATLTIVQDDSTFQTKADGAANVAFGAPTSLCRSFPIGGEIPTMDAGSGNLPNFRWVTADANTGTFFQDFLYRAGIVQTVDGDRVAGFNGGQFRLAPDGITIVYEEGFTQGSTRLVGTPTQTATNDPMVIATACADFTEIALEISIPAGASAQITLADGGDDTVKFFERRFNGEFTRTFPIRLRNGTSYAVSTDPSATAGLSCMVTNATGTLDGTAVTVSVTCTQS